MEIHCSFLGLEKSLWRTQTWEKTLAKRCNFVTKPNVGLLTQSKAKLIYWPWVVVKERTFICRAPVKENVQLMLKKTQTPWWIFVCAKSLLSYMTLYNPMDGSLPVHGNSSVHGILQARILEWVAMPRTRGIFLTQGLNLHLLHWQLGSLPLMPPGKPLMDFRERFLKAASRVWVAECLISLWAFFWLVSGEVTKWYFGISISIFWVQLAYYPHGCVNSFHLVGVLVSAKQLKDMAQNIIYSPCGGTKHSWLWLEISIILSCLTAFLCFCILSLLQLNFLFGTQRKPRRLKLFYRQEAWGTEVCPWEGWQSPAWFQFQWMKI